MLDHAVARDARMEGLGCFVARRTLPIDAAAIGSGGGEGLCRTSTGGVVIAWRTIDRVELRLRPARGVVAEFERVDLGIGRRHRCPEGARLVPPRQQPGNARSDGLGEIVIRPLHRQRAREAGFLAAKRVAGVEIDDRAQRAFVERGFGGLVNHQRAEQFGRKHVEVERAVAVGAGTVGRGRHRLHAVYADAGELRAKPAHGDRAAFAAIALDRDAGDALQRFGQVLVGELRNVFGDDRIDRSDRVLLHVECSLKRLAEAGHDDVLPGILGRGRRRRWLGLRQGNARQEQCERKRACRDTVLHRRCRRNLAHSSSPLGVAAVQRRLTPVAMPRRRIGGGVAGGRRERRTFAAHRSSPAQRSLSGNSS
ncbi:hypothetical protein D9M73_103100 [compost metagenome]